MLRKLFLLNNNLVVREPRAENNGFVPPYLVSGQPIYFWKAYSMWNSILPVVKKKKKVAGNFL